MSENIKHPGGIVNCEVLFGFIGLMVMMLNPKLCLKPRASFAESFVGSNDAVVVTAAAKIET